MLKWRERCWTGCMMFVLVWGLLAVGCIPEESKETDPGGESAEQTCVPGESFESDDGCNTCSCPESGDKNEAMCTLRACAQMCEEDNDCGTGAVEPYCDGDLVILSYMMSCNQETQVCEGSTPEPIDCAADGLSCKGGKCVTSEADTCTPGDAFKGEDGCSTCNCPESGLLSEAECTDNNCIPCDSANDCGSGVVQPYCDGELVILSQYAICNESQFCEWVTPEPIDCSLDGNLCESGECVAQESPCIPGEAFEAADGCNTCICPESGIKSEADCTETSCGPECFEDVDCGFGPSPTVCDGHVMIIPSLMYCNQDTLTCEVGEPGSIDCFELGMLCDNGECFEPDGAICEAGEVYDLGDGCNTCTCPESSLKKEAICTEEICKQECVVDEDCAFTSFPIAPVCYGNTYIALVPAYCDQETLTCNYGGQEEINCEDYGMVCSKGECIEEDDGTCTPGKSFLADDGCNTCGCPDSGLKIEAICTQMACDPPCTADFQCGQDVTPPFCDGTVAYAPSYAYCEPATWTCQMTNEETFDCASIGLICEAGDCVEEGWDDCVPGEAYDVGDGCNTCTCPASGKKSEADCSLNECEVECTNDFQCGSGATPPMCDGDMLYPSNFMFCNLDTYTCEFSSTEPVDCTASGQSCTDGACQ